MIKFLVTSLITLISVQAFAQENRPHTALRETISNVFKKPVFTSLSSEKLPSHEFINADFKKQSSKFKKENYISYFLKVRGLSLVEAEEGILIIESRDASKMFTPVFKKKIPKNTREQFVTLILDIPEKYEDRRDLDKTLRSLYGRDGELRVTPDQKQIVITDWLSNVKRIASIVKNL